VHTASTAPTGLRLSATFNITFPFCIWLSLGQGRIHDQAALGREWYQSVLAVARSDVANSPGIAQMLKLRGPQQMAPTSLQLRAHHPVCRYYGHNSQHLFLKRNQGESILFSTIERLKTDMAMFRQSASTSAAAIPTQGAARESVSTPHLTFTFALRACVITLKLISLMNNVTSVVDVSIALLHTLDTIGRQFYKRSSLVSEDAEQYQLSLQLTQLVVPIMRKKLTLEDSAWQAEVCCKLLSGCMLQVPQSVTCQAVSCQLADTGKPLHEPCAVASLWPQMPYACHRPLHSYMTCHCMRF